VRSLPRLDDHAEDRAEALALELSADLSAELGDLTSLCLAFSKLKRPAPFRTTPVALNARDLSRRRAPNNRYDDYRFRSRHR
jgi:hypothetical protein